jgi:hypothetical protein
MTHVNLDAQPDVIRQFVLALPDSAEGVVLESAGRPVACVVPPPAATTEPTTLGAESQRSGSTAYPMADFLEPVQYGWTEAGHEVRQAIKKYSEEIHADS